MTLDVVVNELLEGAKAAEGTAVIVDIFRATSQLSTLFGLGVKEVYPALGIDEARNLKRDLKKKLHKKVYVCGESDGYTPKDFDFSNSPYLVNQKFKDKLGNKTVVSTTTNGIKGVLSAKKANEVITASFLNYKAVEEYLRKSSPQLITIVGMGEFGKPSDEDRLFSYFLRDILTSQPTNLSRVRDQIYNCNTANWMRQHFGKSINKDIEFCLDTDKAFYVVPKLYGKKLLDALK